MAVSLLFLHLIDANGTQVGGESEDGDYAGEIDIEDIRWSLEKAAIGKQLVKAGGKGETPMKVIPSTLEFTKGPDKSTARLLKAIANGEIMQKAIFTLTERSTLEPFHLIITFLDVRFTNYQLDASDEEAALSMEETWEMTYRQVKFLYEFDGKHEVQLDRPPGADEVEDSGHKSASAVLVDLAEQLKKLSKSDQRRVLRDSGLAAA